MEQRAGADGVELLGEGYAAIADRLVEALDGVEATVGKRLVDERPKMLSRLQLGAVGRLENETDAIGHGQVLRAVPAGIVDLQHDALVGPGANRLGKIRENEFEHLLADGGGDVPHRPAGRGLNEPGDIEPLETMMTEGDRPLPDRRPHAARDRLETNAVFVHRPDLDRRARMSAPLRGRRALEFF